MNTVILAKAFLFVDDPYGDGIRLTHVRNPSPARAVALELVEKGQTDFDAIALMLGEHGIAIGNTLRTKRARAEMVRNTDITEAEALELKAAI